MNKVDQLGFLAAERFVMEIHPSRGCRKVLLRQPRESVDFTI
jgi:hypothetical protein